MAAHEGVGGAGLDGVAPRSGAAAASSAGASFLALLALVQGGGGTAEIDASAVSPPLVEDMDAADDGAGSDTGGASDAAVAAQAGVVVSLSAAAATTAAAASTEAATVASGGDAAPDGAATGRSTGTPILADVASTSAARADGTAASAANEADLAAAVNAGVGGAPQAAEDETSRPRVGVTDGGPQTTATATATATASTGHAAPGRTRHAGAGLEAVTPGRSGRAAASAASAAATRRHGAGAGRADTALAASAEGGATTTRRGTHLAPTTPSADTAERGAAAPQGDAETGSHLATVGSRRAARAATDEAPGDDGSADGDGDTPSTPAAAGPSATTRELPAGVRASSEPLQALAGRAHEPSPADAGARSDALGIVRSDATAQGGSSEGSTRLRASGFGDGAAGLPSWVERLASPDGLAATRRGNALHLDLEPNGLGRIEVRLSFGRDGVRASLLTEHEHTRTLLASQQPQLAAALERNDLRLESLLVDVGTQGGGDGRRASRDAGDATAFDQIGLVHVSEPESAVSEVSVVPGLATRGLVNVRA